MAELDKREREMEKKGRKEGRNILKGDVMEKEREKRNFREWERIREEGRTIPGRERVKRE